MLNRRTRCWLLGMPLQYLHFFYLLPSACNHYMFISKYLLQNVLSNGKCFVCAYFLRRNKYSMCLPSKSKWTDYSWLDGFLIRFLGLRDVTVLLHVIYPNGALTLQRPLLIRAPHILQESLQKPFNSRLFIHSHRSKSIKLFPFCQNYLFDVH